jgi:hypothetical protein
MKLQTLPPDIILSVKREHVSLRKLTIELDQKSNFPTETAYLVQAKSSTDDWQDTKYGSDNLYTTIEKALQLTNKNSSWLGEKRETRIVTSKSTRKEQVESE